MLAVRHHDETCFLALEEFLDDDDTSRVAKRAGEHALGRVDCLVGAPGNDHALARGESVCLDDDRRALCPDHRRIKGRLGKGRVARRRDAVARQELLGKLLAAFEASRESSRAETGEARVRKGVDDTGYEWPFGTDDRQRHAFGTRECDEAGDIHRGDCDVPAPRLGRSARIAWRNENFGHARRLRELPCQRVLAATAADDEYFHRALSAGSAACR